MRFAISSIMSTLYNTMKKDYTELVSFFLRLSLAVPFLYAAISSFLQPAAWVGFFPSWITTIIPGSMLLVLFSVYEIILSVWLMAGKYVYYAALMSSLTLLAIIVFNTGALDIIFRDVGLLLAAVALAVLHYQK